MYRKVFSFGGLQVALQAPRPWLPWDRSARFLVDSEEAAVTIEAVPAGRLPRPPAGAVPVEDRLFVWQEDGCCCVLHCDPFSSGGEPVPYGFVRRRGCHAVIDYPHALWHQVSDRVFFELAPVYGLLALQDALVLHASYLLIRGEKALLFTGPSGMGKSTQAGLWQAGGHGQVINGDRTLIRLTEGGPVACGIFYAGTSGICRNVSAPVAAIVVLDRGADNAVRLLSGAAAFAPLLRQTSYDTWDREQASHMTASVARLAQAVPVLRFWCRPDDSAVAALKQYLEE